MSKAGKLAAAFGTLDRLYAELPTIHCQGRCGIACGPLPLTDLEARRLQLTTHVKPRTVIKLLADGAPHTEKPRERCVYLTAADRCSAYAVRPLICRAWGLVKMLSCMHGCVPDRWLSDFELLRLAETVERLGGGRVVRTTPEGLAVDAGESYGRLAALAPASGRTAADLAADAERTRTLRALHGGRVIVAAKDPTH